MWGVVHRSREHVWPKWMRDHTGQLPAQRASVGRGFALDADGRYFENLPEYSDFRNASILHVVTREVCQTCNNGWMSALERQAKPVFLRLAQAAKTGVDVDLSASDAALLARWAQKTVFTNELTGTPLKAPLPSRWVSTPMMRRQLMDHARPLRGTSLWAARTADYGIYSAEVRLAIGDNYRYTPGETLRYASLTAIAFRHLTLLSYIPNTVRLGGPDFDLTTWARIWPVRSDVSYPPMNVASQHDLRTALLDYRRWLPMSYHIGFRDPSDMASANTSRTRF